MNNMNNMNINDNMGRVNGMDYPMNNMNNNEFYSDDSINMNNSIINYDISFDEANNTIIRDNINNRPPLPQQQKPKPQIQPPQKISPYANMNKMELLKVLNERENEYKTNAVVLNRQGKKSEAFTSLNKYKSIKAAIEVVKLTGRLPNDFEVPESLSRSSTQSNSNGSSHSLNSNNPKSSINSVKSSQLSKLPQGQSQNLNNSRNSSNQSLNPAAPKKSHPNSAFSLPNVRGTGKKFKNGTQAIKFYTEIETKIKKQLTKCDLAIKIYYSKENKQEALRLYKIKKLLNESIESIKILKSNVNVLGDVEIPNFLYESVDYVVENLHEDIDISEMEISIIKATDLCSKEVKTGSFNSYVVCNSHYPTDENAEIFQTKTVNNTSNPEFNFKRKIKINRGKAFLRYIEKKKLVFEVFHVKGFLRRNISIGKATIKINKLSTNSELNFSVNLCDPNNPRKILNSKLDIKVRLHMPLTEHEYITKTEKWAILDMTATPSNKPSQQKQQSQSQLPSQVNKPSIQAQQKLQTASRPSVPARESSTHYQSPSSSNHSSPSINQSSVSIQNLSNNVNNGKRPVSTNPVHPVHGSQAASVKSPSVKSSVQKPSKSPSVSKANEELEKLIEQFEDPTKIVSNEVLENEQSILQKQVAEAKIKKLPTYDELNNKLEAVNLQIQIIVTNIQSGIISIEDYVQQLNDSIANTRMMAIAFKKYGRKDLAKKALIRIKIMEKALEEGDEEEE
jgi:hypothetical protein